jgi:hypothetical protein
MIGKRIPQLPTADTITGDELLVVEQNGRTKSTTASTLVSGTSGIANITDFGARTTKADNYSSIQAAINSGAKQLNWPAGTFNRTSLALIKPVLKEVWIILQRAVSSLMVTERTLPLWCSAVMVCTLKIVCFRTAVPTGLPCRLGRGMSSLFLKLT